MRNTPRARLEIHRIVDGFTHRRVSTSSPPASSRDPYRFGTGSRGYGIDRVLTKLASVADALAAPSGVPACPCQVSQVADASATSMRSAMWEQWLWHARCALCDVVAVTPQQVAAFGTLACAIGANPDAPKEGTS